MARPLEFPGQLREQEQVGLPVLTVGHGAEHPHQVGPVVEPPDELVAALIPHAEAQLLQFSEKCGTGPVPRLPSGAEGVVKVPLRAPGAQQGQLVGGEAVHRGAQHRDQWHVLPGIVDDLKEGEGHADLGGVKEVPAAVGLPGDTPLPQRPGVVVEHRARRAEQNDDVAPPDASGPSFSVRHREAPVQQLPDALGSKAGLLQIPGRFGRLLLPGERSVLPAVLRQVQGVQLHRIVPALREGSPGIQGLVVGVVHLTELP